MIEVSVDNMPTQKAWANELGGVPFPIVSDFHPKGEVAQAYGVYNADRGVAMRSAFVIDGDGVIRYAHEYPAGMVPNPTDLLEEIRSL